VNPVAVREPLLRAESQLQERAWARDRRFYPWRVLNSPAKTQFLGQI
jgi:hypothetical protein